MGNELVYSPPLQTQNECVMLQSKVKTMNWSIATKCVQISMGSAK